MIGLLGKKVGMTQVFDGEGRQVPVTVLQVGPCQVSEIRTKEKHGYTAVQLAFDACRPKNLNKAKVGHLKKSNIEPLRFVREIRTENIEGLTPGAKLRADNFAVGDFVDVEGVSIGRGFQGVVKRHHFKAGEAAHGSKMGREPGSTGQSAYPSRVIKGLRMPGHMGSERVTVQNLCVVQVDVENNLVALNGAVPGYDGSYLVIRDALKKRKDKKWKLEEVKEDKPAEEPKAQAESSEQEAPAEETSAQEDSKDQQEKS
ncbi:MAG: 50S ribosomal protein L3 [Candidatus Omnitrophica bacterium]|nr:50S ribosomal protein L3 [Candidatus Omnitrophota bacterium]